LFLKYLNENQIFHLNKLIENHIHFKFQENMCAKINNVAKQIKNLPFRCKVFRELQKYYKEDGVSPNLSDDESM
jgi:hypothetical protein